MIDFRSIRKSPFPQTSFFLYYYDFLSRKTTLIFKITKEYVGKQISFELNYVPELELEHIYKLPHLIC